MPRRPTVAGVEITTEHPASNYGVPVILVDGQVVDYAAGVDAIQGQLELSAGELAEQIGVSKRTVEGWRQGRPIAPAGLYALAELLRRSR